MLGAIAVEIARDANETCEMLNDWTLKLYRKKMTEICFLLQLVITF